MFCFVSIPKNFFSGRSLFKCTHVEKQRGAEVVRGIGKALKKKIRIPLFGGTEQ